MAEIDLTSDASHKHASEISALCFDGEHLYSGDQDGVIHVWDKDLKFIREFAVHKGSAVIAMVANRQAQLYTSGRDGSLRCFKRPWSHDTNDNLLQTVMDDVTALHVYDNTVYSGNDKGIVTRWYNNKIGAQYNVQVEVRSMAVEGINLYTVRDKDVVITEIKPGHAHKTIGTIPGNAPLILFGAELIQDPTAPVRRGSYIQAAEATRRRSSVAEAAAANLRFKYIVSATRDGKGFTVSKNESPFKELLTKADAHTMPIIAFCMVEDFLFTAGSDSKVKKWENVDKEPKIVEEIDTGKCINAMCLGPEHTMLVADSEGFIKRLRFSAQE